MRLLFSSGALALAATQLATGSLRADTAVRTELYSTGFEAVEGYSTEFILHGQNGWSDEPVYDGLIAEDVIATGVEDGTFPGFGQQGWVGGGFTAGPVDFVSTWHPTVLDPVPTETPIVRFRVLMAIIDSSGENGQYDQFRWSFYNSSTQRLFSVDFDNFDFSTAYQLDDGVFVTEGAPVLDSFGEFVMEFRVDINFAANEWSAWIDGLPIAQNQPVTTTGLDRTLGQIRALWLPANPNVPGDNYMAFDDFTLTAESIPVTPDPPELLSLGALQNGSQVIQLVGEPNCRYALEFSTNGTVWTPFQTNSAADGVFEYVDASAMETPYRFFRARFVPD